MPVDLLLAAGGLVAGAFGAMLGLGGGILVVPLLTLVFGLPLPAAVGTSLVCVVATSNGGAAVNLAAGRADVRLGLSLGAATVVGAIIGALLGGVLPERVLAGLFAAILAYTTVAMLRGLRSDATQEAETEVDPTVSRRTRSSDLSIAAPPTGAWAGPSRRGAFRGSSASAAAS